MKLHDVLTRYKYMWTLLFISMLIAGPVGAVGGGIGWCIDELIFRRAKNAATLKIQTQNSIANRKERLFGEYDPAELIDKDLPVIPSYHNKFAVMFVLASWAYVYVIQHGYFENWPSIKWWLSASQPFFQTLDSGIPLTEKYTSKLAAHSQSEVIPLYVHVIGTMWLFLFLQATYYGWHFKNSARYAEALVYDGDKHSLASIRRAVLSLIISGILSVAGFYIVFIGYDIDKYLRSPPDHGKVLFYLSLFCPFFGYTSFAVFVIVVALSKVGIRYRLKSR